MLKALYAVPIFVEDKHWGAIGFDDCRELKCRTPTEFSVLKVAADCVGSAIQQERNQQAIFAAEQARSAELEKVNDALKRPPIRDLSSNRCCWRMYCNCLYKRATSSNPSAKGTKESIHPQYSTTRKFLFRATAWNPILSLAIG